MLIHFLIHSLLISLNRSRIVSDIDKQSLNFDSNSNIWPLVSAIIYLNENNLENALKSLHNINDLEWQVLSFFLILIFLFTNHHFYLQ